MTEKNVSYDLKSFVDTYQSDKKRKKHPGSAETEEIEDTLSRTGQTTKITLTPVFGGNSLQHNRKSHFRSLRLFIYDSR